MSEELRDISAIPYFAYSPGIYAWIILAASIGIGILSLRIFQKNIRNTKFKAIDKAITELFRIRESLSSSGDTKSPVFAASITVRRLASHVERDEISIMSEKELSQKKLSCKPELKILLDPIIEIERHKYMPSINSDVADKLIANLINSVKAYKSSQDLKHKGN